MFAKLVKIFVKWYFFVIKKVKRDFGPSVPEGPGDGVEGEQHARPHRRPLFPAAVTQKVRNSLHKLPAAAQLSRGSQQ